jgi:ABC-type oligopeptide transport system ATPase subunit
MIAHRLSTVKDCDIIIVLKLGEIVEQGSHDTLLRIPGGHYTTMWEKQSEQSMKESRDKEIKLREEEELKQAIEAKKVVKK